MTIDYATAGRLLEAYGQAWTDFDGDAWVALFTEDVEYHEDPFEAPLVGHNALRRYLLDAAEDQEQVEFTVEQHWAEDATVLGAWHASFIRRSTRARVRLAGFMTLDIAADGRVSRFREWRHRRETPAAGQA